MKENIIICDSCGKKISNMQENWQEQYVELSIRNHVGSILRMFEFCSLKCLLVQTSVELVGFNSDIKKEENNE